MKQCFGYVRVSTVKQGEGVSLTAQKEAIEAFADRQGFSICQWFEEKETAAKSGRPIFNSMVKQLKAHQADGMIIHRIDRSSRNLKDWAMIGELSDVGVDVYFATESLDFRSRGGRLTADIQAVIAADYVRNLSIEARKGINGRLKQGYYPWPAPLGYIDNGGGQLKTLDPLRAPLVRELFDRYLSGNYSIRTLHQTMVDRGLTSKGGQPISKRSVENILQNPFYCGLTRNGRSGETFSGNHEPLITAKQFERIASIREGRYVKKQTKHQYAHRRLFTCTQCGGTLSPERQKAHVYYRCHTVGCVGKTVREDSLDAVVKEALGSLELTETNTAWLETRYQQTDHDQKHQEAVQAVTLKLQRAQTRLSRLTDILLDGQIDQSTHNEKREALLLEISTAKEERQQLDQMAASEVDRQKFFELMKTLTRLYEITDLPERRIIVEMCFSNRTFDGENVYLEPSELVQAVRNGDGVPYGGPIRDTIRTFVERFSDDL